VSQVFPIPPAQPRVFRGLPAVEHEAPLPLALWHLCSLDAPTVAVTWSLAFAWAAGVRLPLWIPSLQALVTWIVYVADRLLDARAAERRSESSRLRLRHRFHWRHRRIFFPLALAATCAAACLVFFFVPIAAPESHSYFARNSVLALAALAYFTRVHSGPDLEQSRSQFVFPLLTKELLVGVLFTAGCALPAFYRIAIEPTASVLPLLICALFFAMLAWLNCHAIERWESQFRSNTRQIFTQATTLAISGAVLAILLTASHPRPAALLATGAASALLLAALDRHQPRLSPIALRAGADLVLLVPIVILVLPR